MSCRDACVVMEYDFANEFARDVMRRAVKSYSCCECKGEIVPGEQYNYAAGKTDGEFWVYRTCVACHEIRRVFSCGSWVFTMLWESIEEQLFCMWNDLLAVECLARLSSEVAIAKMRAMYAKYQEDYT